jgi:hypothetical protein
MSKYRTGILIILAILALVSVASAADITASVNYPATISYWDVDVTSGNALLPTMNNYLGWCGNSTTFITPGSQGFDVYSSLNPGSLPSYMATMDWNRINYILNHKGAGYVASTDWPAVQAAIWYFDGQTYPLSYDVAKFTAIKDDAIANGGGYVPPVGSPFAVILWKADSIQMIFVEKTRTTSDNPPPTPSPEFPSLALPVGMIVGMVGLVYVVKKN